MSHNIISQGENLRNFYFFKINKFKANNLIYFINIRKYLEKRNNKIYKNIFK